MLSIDRGVVAAEGSGVMFWNEDRAGLVTGVDRATIDRVRAELAELAQAARAVESELGLAVRPAIESAEIADWISSARLAYDVMRGTLDTETIVAATLASATAASYELLDMAIDLETRAQFP